MKKILKRINLALLMFIPNIVYADNFFGDYRGVDPDQYYISQKGVDALSSFFGFGYDIMKWAWLLLLSLTIISVIISLVRLAILADDVPYKKANAKHDFAASLIVLAILGATPFFLRAILALFNLFR